MARIECFSSLDSGIHFLSFLSPFFILQWKNSSFESEKLAPPMMALKCKVRLYCWRKIKEKIPIHLTFWHLCSLTNKMRTMNSTDQEIIEKMQSNPNVGMKLLMDTYQERLYWHIRRLVVSHDDAQDLLQETFLKVYQIGRASCRERV